MQKACEGEFFGILSAMGPEAMQAAAAMGPRMLELLSVVSKNGQIERRLYSKILDLCKKETNKDKKAACRALLSDKRRRRGNVTYYNNKGLAATKSVMSMTYFSNATSCNKLWDVNLEAAMIPKDDSRFCNSVNGPW